MPRSLLPHEKQFEWRSRCTTVAVAFPACNTSVSESSFSYLVIPSQKALPDPLVKLLINSIPTGSDICHVRGQEKVAVLEGAKRTIHLDRPHNDFCAPLRIKCAHARTASLFLSSPPLIQHAPSPLVEKHHQSEADEVLSCAGYSELIQSLWNKSAEDISIDEVRVFRVSSLKIRSRIEEMAMTAKSKTLQTRAEGIGTITRGLLPYYAPSSSTVE